MATFGIEEEVFVVEPDKPSLTSLYYLSKLLWSDPSFNYKGTASNFARGKDLAQGLMSGVEVSTDVQGNAADAIEDLKGRRADLARVSEGLIVPIGHLIDFEAPTNVCALQFHVGTEHLERAYDNLTHFLPLLVLITINAPYAGRKYYGQSYRIGESFAIGPIVKDKKERFQDIIVTKRLGTIELRVFDPVWDIKRVEVLAGAIEAIVALKKHLKPEVERYNKMRRLIAVEGFQRELEPLHNELNAIADIPKDMLTITASDWLKEMYEDVGMLATYSAIDNGYRNGMFESRKIPASKAKALKAAAGVAGYYLPKLPYVVWKYLKES